MENGATGATSLKAGCVFTTNKYGSTTAATEVDIVKTVHWRHFLRQMLCLPKNNEVFYFNRLIPKNTDVNSFLLRYLIIGVSAGLSWYNLAKWRLRQDKARINKQKKNGRAFVSCSSGPPAPEASVM